MKRRGTFTIHIKMTQIDTDTDITYKNNEEQERVP